MSRLFPLALLLAALAAAPAVATDEGTTVVAGSDLYKTYCATCHGSSGKGDGPLAEHLRFRPPDLTVIAKKNGSEYPTDKVHRIIDGRNPVKGHGGPDMPVWGDAFKNVRDGYDEAKVKQRITALVDFLRTIQEGAAK